MKHQSCKWHRVTRTAHRLGSPLEKDTSTGDRISVSRTHPVHGYRSQHLQFDGRIGEQYFEDGSVEELLAILVT